MEKKAKRINYKIVQCSSEDSEYPATELLHQSPEAKGWQNKRFSKYPQMIVVQLFETSILNKIAVLSHQSKIATKIEFQIKVNEEDDWKKLGRISLDSNVNTNFQARELKQANINNIQARFIRLILRQNHTNNQNIFNQVGLIGLSFYGERSDSLPPVHQKHSAPKQSNDIDQGTMNRIKELEAKKKRAVEQENYDLAKEIKDEIDRLRSIALQIGSLEERKQEAIRRQNYDDAKIINEEIKKLRHGSTNQTQTYQQPKPVPLRQPTSHYQEEVGDAVSPISNNRTPQQAPKPLQDKPRQQKFQKQEIYQPPVTKARGRPGDDDDRPINVKNTNPYQQAEQEEQVKKESQLQPLNKQLYDECSQHFSVLDEQIMRHIFSKSHTNRQRGIEMVQNELQMTKNRQDFIGACLYVVKNLIDDKVTSVLFGAFNLITQMLKKLKHQQSKYHQPLVDYILDRMSDYLGHVNERIRATVENAFGNIFPMYHLIGKDSCYKALANPGKRDKPPKILTGRLKALNKLVIDYQLGKDYEDVIRYAVKYADDKNNEVRTGAINLLCSIAREINYNTLQPYLKNLRPPIIKSIEDKLDQAGNEPQNYQNFDERPIKPTTSSKTASRGGRQPQPAMQLEVGNEFIDIPKKTSTNFVNEDQMCEFCKRIDKRFVEQDYKDMHYFNACPMLTICNQCGQGIEISTLTSHLVGECANSKYYKKCPRCKEAVHQKNYKSHVEKKQCLPAKPLAAANRCPLCHLDINAGVNGWKQHLVDEGCQNNPRA